MTRKKNVKGLSVRNKKRNNHKTSTKVKNKNVDKKEEKAQKRPKIKTESERCYISNKKKQNITKESREETLKKFQRIRDELNKRNKDAKE